MKYGTTKTTYLLSNLGTTMVKVEKYRNEEVERSMKQYRVRVKVNGSQDEMTEYIRFTDEVAKLREEGALTYDKEDPSTRPMFIIDYPKENIDGSYFVIKCYTILV